MNKVIMIGNLTKDPTYGETNSGKAFCKFSIAINRFDGKEADFFEVVTWNTQAENCSKYLSKGRKVAVVGSLQNRTYEDTYGNKKYLTEIIASEVEFLSPKQDAETMKPVDDNDLPF